MTCGTALVPLSTPPNPPVTADDGLPGWLRQLQSSQPQGSPQAYQSPSSSQAYPNGGGFAAPQPPAQAFGAPPQPFSAGSLVSDDALPDWLRSAGQSSALQAPQAQAAWGPSASAESGYEQGYSAQPGQGQGMGYGAVQPAPRTSGPLGYNLPGNALFDETALPDWLREASRGQAPDPQVQPAPYSQPAASPYGTGLAGQTPSANGYGPYGAFPQSPAPQPPPQSFAQPPSPAQPASTAFPSIDQVGMHQAPLSGQAGLSGRALLDTGALPPWLGGQAGAAERAAGAGNPGGVAAQSLIDESVLPQWLRAESAAPAASVIPAAPPPPASSRIASAANAEPLPAWLDQVYSDANVARIEPQSAPAAWGTPPAPPVPAPAARPLVATGGTGISASEFVDESALPDWLRSQGAMEPNGAPPAPAPFGGRQPEESVSPRYMPASDAWSPSANPAASGQLPLGRPAPQEVPGQFAASDLIDPSAIPSWVRGGEAAPAPSFSSTSGWTSRQPAAPAPTDAGQAWASQDEYESPAAAWDDGASEWDSASYQEPGWSNPQSFRDDDRDAQFSGQFEFDDDGLQDQYASEPWEQRRGQPQPAQDSRRRGPPIPQQELPPWLQGGGPAQDTHSSQGRGSGGYGPMQGGRPMRTAGAYNAGGWDAMPQAGEQWPNWDEGQYGGAGYPQPGGGQQGRQRERGGWRRFFGRK